MKIFVLLLLLGPTSFAREISDRLVSHLKCEQLSVANIYAKILPSAYAQEMQIPMRNWSFSYLANCWSLAHSQRLIYMLSRVGPLAQDPEPELKIVLDQFRGSHPEADSHGGSPNPVEVPLKKYATFLVDGPRLGGSQAWGRWTAGFLDFSPGFDLQRNFTREIESYQTRRFHQVRNLPMIREDWGRSAAENESSFRTMIANADTNRLSLTVLRAERRIQHVVVIKRYERRADGTYSFIVYDSNFPERENHFEYDPRTQQFEGSAVMGPFYGRSQLDRPVGLFVVDEDEQPLIDAALLEYYRARCR